MEGARRAEGLTFTKEKSKCPSAWANANEQNNLNNPRTNEYFEITSETLIMDVDFLPVQSFNLNPLPCIKSNYQNKHPIIKTLISTTQKITNEQTLHRSGRPK